MRLHNDHSVMAFTLLLAIHYKNIPAEILPAKAFKLSLTERHYEHELNDPEPLPYLLMLDERYRERPLLSKDITRRYMQRQVIDKMRNENFFNNLIAEINLFGGKLGYAFGGDNLELPDLMALYYALVNGIDTSAMVLPFKSDESLGFDQLEVNYDWLVDQL